MKASINIYMVRLLIGGIYETDTTSTLKTLAVTGETLVPPPPLDPNVFEYKVEVPNSTKEVAITATKNHVNQTVTGANTETLATGTTFINEFTVRVASEDGEHAKAYTIVVVRAENKSADATLRNLSASGGGTLSPSFDPEVAEYTCKAPYSVNRISLTGEANHKSAKVSNGGSITDTLPVGDNGPYSMVVLAEDLSVKIYTVKVTREANAPPAGDGTPKEWNFSDAAFTSLTSIKTETPIDGLTLIADSNAAIEFDDSSKSIDGYTFTCRLKLGGSGSITSRAVKFDVTGACTVTVYLLSSSSGSGDPRTLVVHDGTSQVGTISAPPTADGMGKGSVSYTGGTGSLYLYSQSSGINLYLVKVEY